MLVNVLGVMISPKIVNMIPSEFLDGIKVLIPRKPSLNLVISFVM